MRLAALLRGELLRQFGDDIGAAGEGGRRVVGGFFRFLPFRHGRPLGGERLPACFPLRRLRLRGIKALLLLDQDFGQFLPALLVLLPVPPFAVALLQPDGGFGGGFIAGFAQRCAQLSVEFGLFLVQGVRGFREFGLAKLAGLRRLLQQLLLVAGIEQGLGAVGGDFAGGVQRLFALVGGLQALGELGQRQFGGVAGGGQGGGLLPGVGRERRFGGQAGEQVLTKFVGGVGLKFGAQ